MRVRLIDSRALVYRDMDLHGLSVDEIVAGAEFDMGGVKKRNGIEWREVTLSGGLRGYVVGNTNVFVIKKASLLENETNVYGGPSDLLSLPRPLRRVITLM